MGWQWAFIIVGGIGFAWLGFWFIIYDSPKNYLPKEKSHNRNTITYIAIKMNN